MTMTMTTKFIFISALLFLACFSTLEAQKNGTTGRANSTEPTPFPDKPTPLRNTTENSTTTTPDNNTTNGTNKTAGRKEGEETIEEKCLKFNRKCRDIYCQHQQYKLVCGAEVTWQCTCLPGKELSSNSPSTSSSPMLLVLTMINGLVMW